LLILVKFYTFSAFSASNICTCQKKAVLLHQQTYPASRQISALRVSHFPQLAASNCEFFRVFLTKRTFLSLFLISENLKRLIFEIFRHFSCISQKKAVTLQPDVAKVTKHGI
jgi:hypothetical protein